MVNYQLIAPILRCPITHASLRPLTDLELNQLNSQIRQEQAVHLDGTRITDPVQAGLISEPGGVIYRIQEEIAILLGSLAILPQGAQLNFATDQNSQVKVDLNQLFSPDKQAVRSFYDEIGWQQDPRQVYQDAARFEDLRPVSADYRHRCHRRVNQYLQKPGRFLLDIASGPIQYEEYLSYSEGYDYRICGDLSFRALQQARQKVGDRGFYLLCDLTHLPLQSHCLDGAVSLHTIYHIPAMEQETAFLEIHRALKPGATAAVVYSWSGHSHLMQLSLLPIKLLRAGWSKLQATCNRSGVLAEPELYFHTHSYAWFMTQLHPQIKLKIVVWRSISVLFMQSYLFGWAGKQFLNWLFYLENRFPYFWGKVGAYPIVVMQKQDCSDIP